MMNATRLITTLIFFIFGLQATYGKALIVKPSSGTISTDSLIRFSECFFNIDELCEHGGNTYGDLDKWQTDNCLECTCYSGVGVLCCNKVWYPVDWPTHCMPVLQRSQCKIKLVEKEDGRQECSYERDSIWRSRME